LSEEALAEFATRPDADAVVDGDPDVRATRMSTRPINAQAPSPAIASFVFFEIPNAAASGTSSALASARRGELSMPGGVSFGRVAASPSFVELGIPGTFGPGEKGAPGCAGGFRSPNHSAG